MSLITRPNQYKLNMESDYTGWINGVRFPVKARVFLLTTVSRSALGPNHPPSQWVSGNLTRGGGERSVNEADHSPPSNAQFKNVRSYIFTLPIRLHGVVLN
jgi:hypothetical protein